MASASCNQESPKKERKNIASFHEEKLRYSCYSSFLKCFSTMGSLGMVNFPRSMKNTSANSFFCSGVQLAAASASVLNAFEIAMFSDESVGIRFWALAQKLQNTRVIKRSFFIGKMLMTG